MYDNRNRRPGTSSGNKNQRPAIRRVRRKRFTGPIIAALVMTVMVIIAIVFLVLLVTGKLELSGNPDPPDSDSRGSSGETLAPITDKETERETETEETAPQETEYLTQPDPSAPVNLVTGYENISVENTGLHKGDLILVNYQYAYVTNDSKSTLTIYGNKNSSYKLSTSLLEVRGNTLDALNSMMLAFSGETGKNDVIVRAAYRSIEDQKALYETRAAAYGEDNAKKYLAMPGYSEHHTGMCVDLGIYPDDGKVYELDGMSGYADWFIENSPKFGFVLRFPENKADITKVTSDKWHFRYIGQVHAETMTALNLCLEEYIAELRKYPYNGDHLIITASSGKKYEVYYQYASDAEETEISVPENLPYTISGDNAEGFVVTVALSE